jgi:hypothetical protein
MDLSQRRKLLPLYGLSNPAWLLAVFGRISFDAMAVVIGFANPNGIGGQVFQCSNEQPIFIRRKQRRTFSLSPCRLDSMSECAVACCLGLGQAIKLEFCRLQRERFARCGKKTIYAIIKNGPRLRKSGASASDKARTLHQKPTPATARKRQRLGACGQAIRGRPTAALNEAIAMLHIPSIPRFDRILGCRTSPMPAK